MNKVKLSLYVAMDEQRGIGKDNKIPWHIKDDLVRLKNKTVGHIVILGRTTFESMLWYYQKSGRPTMEMRTHLVVTTNPDYKVDKKYGYAVHSIEEALEKAAELVQSRYRPHLSPLLKGEEDQGSSDKMEVFVLGGARIFEQTIDKADKIYATIVHEKFDADTFFPDYSDFRKTVFKEDKFDGGLHYTYLDVER